MLYLLDANVLITANSTYYPIDQVPEFWSWIGHEGLTGNIMLPLEIMEEVKAGRKDKDLLISWLSDPEIVGSLLLEEEVNTDLVQQVVSNGYADDLTDDEVDKLGRDPFLIAYALAASTHRTVVTVEVSKPSATRHNRKVPDVCRTLGVQSCGPFTLNRVLGFSTGWKANG